MMSGTARDVVLVGAVARRFHRTARIVRPAGRTYSSCSSPRWCPVPASRPASGWPKHRASLSSRTRVRTRDRGLHARSFPILPELKPRRPRSTFARSRETPFEPAVAARRMARRPDAVSVVSRPDRFFPPDFHRRRRPPPHVERLGIEPDEIDGGHCVALSRPRELVDLLETLRSTAAGSLRADARVRGGAAR